MIAVNNVPMAGGLIGGLILALATALGWWAASTWLSRKAERGWWAAVDRFEETASGESLEARWARLSEQRALIGRGSPVERMFMAGVAAMGALAMLAWVGVATGIAPASALERALMLDLRSIPHLRHGVVGVALDEIDSSVYTSKGDVEHVAHLALETLRLRASYESANAGSPGRTVGEGRATRR